MDPIQVSQTSKKPRETSKLGNPIRIAWWIADSRQAGHRKPRKWVLEA